MSFKETFEAWRASRAVDPAPSAAPSAPSAAPSAMVLITDPAGQAALASANQGDATAERARRKRFALEFCRCGRNSIEAARRAGYPRPTVDGPRVVRLKTVQEMIRKQTAAELSVLDATPENTVLELTRIARRDLRGFYDEQGRLKHPRELTPDQAAIVKRVKQGAHGLEIEFESKQEALGLLSKIQGIHKTVVEHTGSVAHRIDTSQLSPAEIDELLALAPPVEEGDDSDDIEDADWEEAPGDDSDDPEDE